MSELDLINLARSTSQNEVAWFAQVITINFAMIVAIYYFLNQAKIALKIFSFIAYMMGSLIFLGEILIESNIKVYTLEALKALPHPSLPTDVLVTVSENWLGRITGVIFSSSFWVLWIGIFYLLFFWKKSEHERP